MVEKSYIYNDYNDLMRKTQIYLVRKGHVGVHHSCVLSALFPQSDY